MWKNRVVRRKFILGVRHPTLCSQHSIVHYEQMESNFSYNIVIFLIVLLCCMEMLSTYQSPDGLVASAAMIFVNGLHGKLFLHIFPKDLEVCIKLQELASPA